jgi:hypothetical protein
MGSEGNELVENVTPILKNKTNRPLGVTLIAIVVMVFGAVAALFGLLGMLSGFAIGLMGFPGGAGFAFLAGFVGLVLGLVYICAGIGLWNLNPWAWWLAFLAGIIGFVFALGSPVWMVVWALVVGYLFIVRAHFGTLPAVPRIVNA